VEIEILHRPDAARWNAAVERLAGSVHHTAEWATFTGRRGGLTPYFLEGAGGGLAAVAYVARPSRWPLSQWATIQCDALPATADIAAALRPLEEALRTLGGVDLALGSFAAPATIELAPFGYGETRRLEFVLDLEGGLDAAHRGFRKTQRHEIRKFEGSGAVCVEASDAASIDWFCSIEEATLERHRAQGKDYARTNRRTLEILWEDVVRTGRGRAYFALRNGIAVSTAVVGVCGRRLYLLYSGSSAEGFSIHASKGLLWHVLCQEHARGARECNLGGVPPDSSNPDSVDHGLYRFKQGFGGVERVCISGRKTLRPVAARCREALLWVRSLLRSNGANP
jgi:hypothetical protein